jgi:hypothetical protein
VGSVDEWAKARGGRRSDLPKEDDLLPEQRKALDAMRREAKQNGATLATGGKGGLDPRLVLGLLRKAKWRCKKCGGAEDLSVHHKAGAKNLVGERLLKRGKTDDQEGLAVICEPCHDDIHDEDRAAGGDHDEED